MAGRDLGLESVRTRISGEFPGTLERRKASVNEELIPASAVLLEQRNRFPHRADPCAQPRRLDLHQSEQPVNFRFRGGEARQDTAEPERILAGRAAFYGKADMSFDTSGRSREAAYAAFRQALRGALGR